MGAPTSWAISIERSIFAQASLPKTRWVSSRVGAWIETIGSSWWRESAASAGAFCVIGSVQIMTSMPSYPSRAPTSKAAAVVCG